MRKRSGGGLFVTGHQWPLRAYCARQRPITLFRSILLIPKGLIMEIKTVGVIGAGTMGNGIAHVFAKGGYSVVLLEVEQRFLDRGLQTIGKNLEREVSKAKLTAEQRDQALGRIRGVTNRQELGSCDFVVEAA